MGGHPRACTTCTLGHGECVAQGNACTMGVKHDAWRALTRRKMEAAKASRKRFDEANGEQIAELTADQCIEEVLRFADQSDDNTLRQLPLAELQGMVSDIRWLEGCEPWE